ncbi:MAG: transglutaminase-like domain-containing protein [Panacagrimonas sp.]
MTTPEELHFYRQPGRHVDSDHPGVVALARKATADIRTEREQAVALYYAVRDGFRYDPYVVKPNPSCFTASGVIESGRGFCISKAALLAAAARAVGIPARVGFADVKNHLTSPRLREMMGSDEFIYHGYAELWIDGRWVKSTPAFDRKLCEKAGVHPLEFDGRQDSLFHPLDRAGRVHMQYLRDHGSHTDVPVQEILEAWRRFYPSLEQWGREGSDARFETEAVGAGSV